MSDDESNLTNETGDTNETYGSNETDDVKQESGRRRQRKPRKRKGPLLYRRRRGRRTDEENEGLLELLKPSEQDVMKLLAAQTHVGRKRAHLSMKRYVWKRREDGIHVINLDKTWAKLILAARILVTVRDPADICVMSSRMIGQRGAIKFAHYIGATPCVGQWVPGSLTNPQNRAFFEPRVILCDDPKTCFPALKETSYTGIPVISLCGTDNQTRFVDCAIPCNNRGRYSVGLMFWLLTREVLRMKGDPSCIRDVEWKESVDLFFYRDADAIKRQQDAQNKKKQEAQRAQYGDEDDYGDVEEPMEEQYEDEPQYAMNVQYQDMGQQDWGMPDTEIEHWGAIDDEDQQQPMYDDQQQQQQQQPQYVDDQGVYGQQGYDDPNQDPNQGGMGMQNW